jgi:anti-sigma regulatory factor (Ser/Thr protein kinase)
LVEDLGWFAVDDSGGAGSARRAAVEAAERMGFSAPRRAELTTALTEIGTNLHRHADNGRIAVRCLREPGRGGVEVIATDTGPGMADLELSGRDGHSTAGSLGIGLGAISRMASRVDGYSLPGKGTVLTAQFWPERETGTPPAEGLTRPMTGERSCGDRFAVRLLEDGLLLLVSDGLGHGPLAAAASTAVLDQFLGSRLDAPGALLEHLHSTVAYTRGAAVSIARVEGNTVWFAGLGNVAGWITWPDGQRRGMVAMPGIVGHQNRGIREFRYESDADALIVMHSDGVSDRWRLTDYPGLSRRSPLVTAATLLRDAGVRRDDACVAVVRQR